MISITKDMAIPITCVPLGLAKRRHGSLREKSFAAVIFENF
jgi:hypothetical protein